ncbi:hypothetical protein [Nocardia aurea]|uniref:Uncharacterized protein n=1 Tax=Nocardia aurea TaxID=2144174 RepID=A0ABV3FS45_9NOCA
MVFNIGSQQGNINNVAGDQTIHGGQHGTFVSAQAVEFATELAAALHRSVGMEQAAADADAVQNELRRPHPDRRSVADRLIRIARAVTAVTGMTAAVRTPLVGLARWLGELGTPIFAALGL